MDRAAEYQRIKEMIADLEGAGVTLYKLALMLGEPYNTVKHWKSTGRVESHDAKELTKIHGQYARQPVCQIQPQYCEVSHIRT